MSTCKFGETNLIVTSITALSDSDMRTLIESINKQDSTSISVSNIIMGNYKTYLLHNGTVVEGFINNLVINLKIHDTSKVNEYRAKIIPPVVIPGVVSMYVSYNYIPN